MCIRDREIILTMGRPQSLYAKYSQTAIMLSTYPFSCDEKRIGWVMRRTTGGLWFCWWYLSRIIRQKKQCGIRTNKKLIYKTTIISVCSTYPEHMSLEDVEKLYYCWLKLRNRWGLDNKDKKVINIFHRLKKIVHSGILTVRRQLEFSTAARCV